MAGTETGSDWAPPPKGVRWTDAVGRAMVESLRSSGLSQGAFARGCGENPQRVKYWLDRIEGRSKQARPSRGGRQAAAVTFAPVRIAEGPRVAASSPALEVVVGTAVVRVPPGFDEQHLVRVVTALGGVAC